ncbi:N-terminal acetyltransferase A complex auxiliary subunit NAA15-like [Humulus lupulus]|uniref:N-terminal acetyltransferase A complex auxiliary subunit NAA15-like n=1 Tax=Humulus lupulus TaxID=3486 RepID=UPI002B404014|nr:N-terminal acetyltransferase A complex auxiliary subunit NAA15-like [Humulus lupulus]
MFCHVTWKLDMSSFCRNRALGPIREWTLEDCVRVHKLLEIVLLDHDAALRWKEQCAKYSPYSTYFEGRLSSAMPNSVYNQSNNSENGNHSVVGQTAESLASNEVATIITGQA